MAIYEEVNGKKPDYAKEGDIIVTGGGSYVVQADGTGKLVDKDINTDNYQSKHGGTYDPDPSTIVDPNVNPATGQVYGAGYGGNTVPSGSITSLGPGNTTVADYYKTAMQQQNASVDAATNAAVYQYQSQVPGINRSYDELAKQAYINYMTGKKDLKSDLSSMGLGTQGVTESSLNQANSAYSGNLNQSELARQNSLDAIKAAMAQVRGQGAQSIAANQAALTQQLAAYYQSQEQQNSAYARQDADIARQTALAAIQSGFYDEATAIAAGLTPEQGRYLAAEANKAKQRAYSGGTPTPKPAFMDANVALALLQSGQITPEVRAALENKFGTSLENIAAAYGIPLPGTADPNQQSDGLSWSERTREFNARKGFFPDEPTDPKQAENMFYELESRIKSGQLTILDFEDRDNMLDMLAAVGAKNYDRLYNLAQQMYADALKNVDWTRKR